MTITETVAIWIEAADVEELPVPTSAVRWHVLDRQHTHFPLVHIEGTREDVEAFVRTHWGDEMFSYEAGDTEAARVDSFFADYAAGR